MTTGPESPERDPALERAWRAHSREGPPAALDRTILAAAHRAVGSGPAAVTPGREANRPQRWWMPLAAAATIGAVAVGLLQMSPRDESIVAPTDRVAAVAPQRELAKTAPTEAPAAPASSVESKTKRVPAPSSPPAASEAVAARGQDAQRLPPSPAAAALATAPPPAVPALPAAPPPAMPGQRDAPAVLGKLAERAPDPFPAAQAPRRTDSAETRTAPAADAAATAGVAPTPRAEPAAAPAPPVAEDKRELARKDGAEADRQVAAAAPPAAAAPASAGAAAPRATPAPPVAGMRARENAFVGDVSREQAAPTQPAFAKRTAPTEDARMKARDPDAWIAQIRKLRDEGRTAEAIRELRDFRELVPDADRRIPEDLRELARSIRP